MRSFAEVLRGHEGAYGAYVYDPNEPLEEGVKRMGRPSTVRSAVTPFHYEEHLAGRHSLGLVPIRDDGTVSFVAIDLDDYDKGLSKAVALRMKIEQKKLPLVLCLSKSFGCHLYLFFKVPVKATVALEYLHKMRDILGIPEYIEKKNGRTRLETFPKQDDLRKVDVGNWINIPYFGDTRRALGMDGQELTLEEFLQEVYAKELGPEDLNAEHVEDRVSVEEDYDMSDMAPCIETLLAEGIPEGSRNTALLQIAIGHRKRAEKEEGRDWQAEVYDINREHCHPPLHTREIGLISKQAEKPALQFMCHQEPMVSMCDKVKCAKRKYGIGGDKKASTEKKSAGTEGGKNVDMDAEIESLPFRITRITKIEASPVYYKVDIFGFEGKPLILKSTELDDPIIFVRVARERLDEVWASPKKFVLVEVLRRVFAAPGEKYFVEEAPIEMEDVSNVIRHFDIWVCFTLTSGVTEAQIKTGKPVYINGKLYFQGKAYMSFLESYGVKMDQKAIWEGMRSRRFQERFAKPNDEVKIEPVMADGKMFHGLWCVPLRDETWILDNLAKSPLGKASGF